MTPKSPEQLFEKLEDLLVHLDDRKSDIWKLRDKDYEDLKWSIKIYHERIQEAHKLIEELYNTLDDAEGNNRLYECENRFMDHEDNYRYLIDFSD